MMHDNNYINIQRTRYISKFRPDFSQNYLRSIIHVRETPIDLAESYIDT